MIGFEGAIFVEAEDYNGWLTMFWRNKEEVVLNSYSKNHIDIKVII